MTSVSAELIALVGVEQPRQRPVSSNWQELCICGHLSRYHAQTVGGTAPAHPEGLPSAASYVFHGCIGELPPKGTVRREVKTQKDGTPLIREMPTCPCEEFRPVARVDRPSRYFNQKRPIDRSDLGRHPFLLGMRAYRTRLLKVKAVDGDTDKRDAEFDRRFAWLDGKRVCSLSKCTATEDVWPVFVDDRDHSELRCPRHR
jgi:hypothetical protein